MAAHCESCAFYDEHHTNTGKQAADEGLCRFNPPVSQPAPDAHGLWPVVGLLAKPSLLPAKAIAPPWPNRAALCRRPFRPAMPVS